MQVPASSPAAPTHLRPATVSVLGHYVNFWRGRHPFTATRTVRTIWFLPLWLAALSVGYAIALAVGILITAFGGTEIENHVATFVSTQSPLKVLLLAVFVAPIWEETAFRLPISATPWTAAVGGAFLTVIAIPGLFGVSSTGWLERDKTAGWIVLTALLAQLVIVGIAIFASFSVWRRRHPIPAASAIAGSAAPRRTGRHLWAIGATVLFAAAHLSNFAEISVLTPALVVPQLLLGSVIMFARVERSWWLGLGIHAANNLLAVGVALAMRESELAGVIVGLAFLGVVGLGGIFSWVVLALNATSDSHTSTSNTSVLRPDMA